MFMKIKNLPSIILLLCISAGLLTFSGCGKNHENENAESENNLGEIGIMNSLQKFSLNSASKIFSNPENNLKNTSYSPVSLYMALALAATGAENKTKDEIFSVLELKDKDKNHIAEQTANLFAKLPFENENGSLHIANSLWMQKNIAFKDDFIENAEKKFYSGVYSVDFADKNTAALMNKWVSDNTKNLISPDIQIDKSTILFVLNTLYFKDRWQDAFFERSTAPDKFYTDIKNEDKFVDCDFMNKTEHMSSYIKGGNFTCSWLYLKNGGKMMFILPDKNIEVSDLFKSPDKLNVIFDETNAEKGEVIYKIPKFSAGSKLKLNDILKSLGMKKAFEGDADFSAMTDGGAFISEISQETCVKIDEYGVEAAAFTAIAMAGGALQEDDNKIYMILDRPFIYFITDKNNAILFIGTVYNPAED